MNDIIKTTLRAMFRDNAGAGIRICAVRKSKAVYFMAYVLELIFFALRSNFLPFGYEPLGIRAWTIVYPVHMAASLIVMLLWSDKFRKLLRGTAVVMLIGFIPYVFLPEGLWRFIFGLIGYIGLGGVVTGCRCGYAFVANNSERFFGIVSMFFSVTLLRLFSSFDMGGIILTCILPLILLGLLAFCLFSFREEDFEVRKETSGEDAKGLFWALAYFVLYFAVDGFINELLDKTAAADYTFFIIGAVITGVMLILFFRILKLTTWHLWNLFFLLSIGAALFAVFAPKIGTARPLYLFSGLANIGWPLCIYTLGCAQKRFADYRLLKKCTLLYVVISPATTFANEWVVQLFPEALPQVTLVYMLAVTIILLMLSPFSYKYLFSSLWISDLYESDMSGIQEKKQKTDRFARYDLTPRQKEVAAYLLAGNTRRQIAGELGISESTVRMHTEELYKRLQINSRVELFRLFGTIDPEDPSVG